MKRIYLAGPDVFFSDVRKRSAHLKQLCANRGLEGVFPLDSNLDLTNFSPRMRGRMIFEANVESIRSCDGVLANMNPFRGPSADVGTVWETGFAYAFGKPIACYSEHLSNYADRVTPDEHLVEDFGLFDNLMLAWSPEGDRHLWGHPEGAIDALAHCLKRETGW